MREQFRTMAFAGLGTSDAHLVAEVSNVRLGLNQPYESNAVVADPMLPAYEPYILESGVMHLGEYGVIDFSETFKDVEVDGRELLVVYSAVRHCLEAKRRDPTSNYHEALRGIARLALRHKLVTGMRSRSQTEDLLIGYFSARCAQLRSATRAVAPKAAKERLPAQIQSAADARVRHNTSEYRRERQQVMRHFSLSVPRDVDKSMMAAAQTAIKTA